MLIASMAAISGREETLQSVVNSVLDQSRSPDKLLIYYSVEPWHLDSGWKRPPKLRYHPALELIQVPNLGSSRKYLFALQSFRATASTIILIDDDRTWHPAVFERLQHFVHTTNCVATTRGWSRYQLITSAAGNPLFDNLAVDSSQVDCPTQIFIANSGWATCFQTDQVAIELFSTRLQEEYLVQYSDEIFLSAMIKRPKFVIPLPPGFCTHLQSSLHQWLSPNTTTAKLKQVGLMRWSL